MVLLSVVSVCVFLSVCQHDNSEPLRDRIRLYHHNMFRAPCYGRKGGQVRIWLYRMRGRDLTSLMMFDIIRHDCGSCNTALVFGMFTKLAVLHKPQSSSCRTTFQVFQHLYKMIAKCSNRYNTDRKRPRPACRHLSARPGYLQKL